MSDPILCRACGQPIDRRETPEWQYATDGDDGQMVEHHLYHADCAPPLSEQQAA
jgi:hypothetical protein